MGNWPVIALGYYASSRLNSGMLMDGFRHALVLNPSVPTNSVPAMLKTVPVETAVRGKFDPEEEES